jgi:tight adherence protein C
MRPRAARRATAARQAAFPDAIEFVALAIRAGHTPRAAVQHAARYVDASLEPAFAEFEHRCARGASFADALAAFADAIDGDARMIVDALAAADRYGLPIAPVLDRLVDDARDHRRRRAEEAARRLPISMAFPLVVCTLPSFVLLAVVPAVLGAVVALRHSLP